MWALKANRAVVSHTQTSARKNSLIMIVVFFSEIIPSRRTKRSLIGTIATLIVVLFLINYLLELSKVGQ